MIRKSFILVLLGIANILYAQKQVLEQYPVGQDFYEGGVDELNKEIVRVVKEQKLGLCGNAEEKYTVKILVNENSTINYVKDFDSIGIQKNKCAFDYSRKIIPHLKKWLSAKENGESIAAITKIEIKPFYLYYSKENPSNNKIENPVYIKGMSSFANEVERIFQKRIRKNEEMYTNFTFIVNEKGEMKDFKIESNSYTDEEKESMVNGLSNIKGKWRPATFNDIPIKIRLRQPIAQKFDYDLEHKEKMKLMNQNMYNNRYR